MYKRIIFEVKVFFKLILIIHASKSSPFSPYSSIVYVTHRASCLMIRLHQLPSFHSSPYKSHLNLHPSPFLFRPV